MSLGISNAEIWKFIEKNGNNLKRNFTGVLESSHIKIILWILTV